MGCSATGYKIFLVVFNVLFVMSGLSMILYGIKMRMSDVEIYSIVAIAVGSIVAATGSSGCFGACCEIGWLLLAHVVGLSLLIIKDVIAAILLLIAINRIRNVQMEVFDPACGEDCSSPILTYASVMAGIAIACILLEILMIYSSVQLYKDIKNRSLSQTVGQNMIFGNSQMAGAAPPPLLLHEISAQSPQATYVPLQQTAAYPNVPLQQTPAYSNVQYDTLPTYKSLEKPSYVSKQSSNTSIPI